MELHLRDSHFSGKEEVQKDITSPPLGDKLRIWSGADGLHQGSHDYLYRTYRTTVMRRGFAAYRDAAIFLSAKDGVAGFGLMVHPRDDVEHSDPSPLYDSEVLRRCLAAGPLPFHKWRVRGGTWALLVDDVEREGLPPEALSEDAWNRLESVVIRCTVKAADIVSLPPTQQGQTAYEALQPLVRCLMEARKRIGFGRPPVP